jgi:hypothetical protein
MFSVVRPTMFRVARPALARGYADKTMTEKAGEMLKKAGDAFKVR